MYSTVQTGLGPILYRCELCASLLKCHDLDVLFHLKNAHGITLDKE